MACKNEAHFGIPEPHDFHRMNKLNHAFVCILPPDKAYNGNPFNPIMRPDSCSVSAGELVGTHPYSPHLNSACSMRACELLLMRRISEDRAAGAKNFPVYRSMTPGFGRMKLRDSDKHKISQSFSQIRIIGRRPMPIHRH